MSVTIKFTSHAREVQEKLERCAYAYLEEGSAEIESAAIKNSPVGETGRLRGDWRHVVDVGKREAVIGNSAEHAIWVERGTGEYAINGDGRKGKWTYRDAQGNFHVTTGNPPHRMLERAWNEKIDRIRTVLLPAKFKEMGG